LLELKILDIDLICYNFQCVIIYWPATVNNKFPFVVKCGTLWIIFYQSVTQYLINIEREIASSLWMGIIQHSTPECVYLVYEQVVVFIWSTVTSILIIEEDKKITCAYIK
jgi:hypothetical protein